MLVARDTPSLGVKIVTASNRLQQHGFGLGKSFAHADARRRAKGHVGRINRVIGAVHQHGLDVDHRKAERPCASASWQPDSTEEK